MDRQKQKAENALLRIKALYGLENGPLGYESFEAICAAQSVLIVRVATSVKGFFFRIDDNPVIALSDDLTADELTKVAFHELGHYLLGQSELEADLFAIAAIT